MKTVEAHAPLGTGSSLSCPLKSRAVAEQDSALRHCLLCSGHGLCEKYEPRVLHRVRRGFLWGLHELRLRCSHSDKPSS